MHHTVIIVGTNHEYQWRDPIRSSLELQSFREFLVKICSKHKVAAIAEEMSVEALSIHNCSESVPAEIARELNLPHQYSDPEQVEQDALQIANDGAIEAYGHIKRLRREQIDELIEEQYRKRERAWLSNLNRLNRWPLLFICGSIHTASFAQQLRNESINVEIEAENWDA